MKFRRRSLRPGLYRNLSGNQALALGFVTAAQKVRPAAVSRAAIRLRRLRTFCTSFRSTKISDVMTFQAEDEIAAITSAIGAAYAGALAHYHDFRPGHGAEDGSAGTCRMTVEIPLVICDIQRGGPSTGLPTKTEQADLLQALFGRNSEAPIPVLAASTPGDCFWVARRSLPHRHQVHGSGDHSFRRLSCKRRRAVANSERRRNPGIPRKICDGSRSERLLPYKRDPETLARPWAVPGTPGLSTASAASKNRTSPATSTTSR